MINGMAAQVAGVADDIVVNVFSTGLGVASVTDTSDTEIAMLSPKLR